MGVLTDWAHKWRIPPAAMAELVSDLGGYPESEHDGRSEGAAQSRVRLEHTRRGGRLWRNNVGVLRDETGRPVRYGLANDSKRVNEEIKSADLIGITPVVVTPDKIGQTLGVFTSYEVKREGWHYTGTKREEAQARWAAIIRRHGGIAKFISNIEEM